MISKYVGVSLEGVVDIVSFPVVKMSRYCDIAVHMQESTFCCNNRQEGGAISCAYWERNGTEENGTERNGTEHNRTQQNRTQQNTTKHNTTEHNTAQQNTAQQNTTQQNTTEENRIDGTKHNRTQQNRTEENRIERNGAERSRTERNGTEHNRTTLLTCCVMEKLPYSDGDSVRWPYLPVLPGIKPVQKRVVVRVCTIVLESKVQ
jgi:hypothetical protein